MARPKSIAVWIRRNRQANGWTQVALARKLGYANSSSVNLWESGSKSPSDVAMAAMEKLFGAFEGKVSREAEATDVEVAEFVLWLRNERNRQELTLAQLSELSGVNISTLSQIENGKITSPQRKTREKLISVLGDQAEPAPTAPEPEKPVQGIGEFQEFNPYVDEERPTTSGIYVFYDVSERPVYVGEGGNIRKRIKDHEDKFWFKRPIVETGAYIEVTDEKLRVRIEKMLIRFLKSNAVINKQHVER